MFVWFLLLAPTSKYILNLKFFGWSLYFPQLEVFWVLITSLSPAWEEMMSSMMSEEELAQMEQGGGPEKIWQKMTWHEKYDMKNMISLIMTWIIKNVTWKNMTWKNMTWPWPDEIWATITFQKWPDQIWLNQICLYQIDSLKYDPSAWMDWESQMEEEWKANGGLMGMMGMTGKLSSTYYGHYR